MKTKKQLNRLKKIHILIASSKTGTPEEFARKLAISQSQLYNILDELKVQGFPIAYSRKRKCYFYSEFCELEIDYAVRLIKNDTTIILD